MWIFLLTLTACGPAPEDTGDTGDTGDTDTTPERVSTVDLSGARALVVLAEEQRSVFEAQGELYKELDDGTVVRLFPEGWTLDSLASGSDVLAVAFDHAHRFGTVEGGELTCRIVYFDLATDGEADLYCALPTGRYEECADPEAAGCGLTGFLDVGPDGTLWIVFDEEGVYKLYAYRGGQATLATPVGLIHQDDPRPHPVTGGVIMNGEVAIESYWLEPDQSASVKIWDDHSVPGAGPRYAGSLLVDSFGAGLLLVDTASRELVPLADEVDFDVPPTGPVRFDLAAGDEMYVAQDGGQPVWRCDGTQACTTAEDDPVYPLLRDAIDRLSAGGTTWVRTVDEEHHFIHGDVVSGELGDDLQIARVKVLGDALYFEGLVVATNTGGLFRVDFVDGAFVYTEVETYESTVTALVPLEP